MANAEAAERTTRALVGLPAEWTVLRDVDHVVVGPGGVFVIDSRSSTVKSVVAAADALARGASLDRRLVRPVLCLDGRDTHGDVGTVLVCTPETIVRTLLAQKPVLEREELTSAGTTVASVVARRRGRKATNAVGVRRDGSSGSMARMGVILLLLAAIVSALPWAAAEVRDLRTDDPPTLPHVGETARLASTSTRPPLDLTPELVDDADPSAYVVRLTVRNDGDRAFAMGHVTASLGLDDLTSVADDRHGPAQLAGVRLEPGKERALTYRFLVPDGGRAHSFVVVVGGLRTDRARWQVP